MSNNILGPNTPLYKRVAKIFEEQGGKAVTEYVKRLSEEQKAELVLQTTQHMADQAQQTLIKHLWEAQIFGYVNFEFSRN